MTRILWFMLFLTSLFGDLYIIDQAMSYGAGYLHFAVMFIFPMIVYQSTMKVLCEGKG